MVSMNWDFVAILKSHNREQIGDCGTAGTADCNLDLIMNSSGY